MVICQLKVERKMYSVWQEDTGECIVVEWRPEHSGLPIKKVLDNHMGDTINLSMLNKKRLWDNYPVWER